MRRKHCFLLTEALLRALKKQQTITETELITFIYNMGFKFFLEGEFIRFIDWSGKEPRKLDTGLRDFDLID